jgi:NAD(P)-dependent dehydrogenase (short-subunit alcohol dehydrogenase family)
MSMDRYAGKVALVTGGSSGIGLAVARRIAREGGTVVIAARRKDMGDEAAAKLRADGGEALFVQADVTVEDDVARLVETVSRTYGRLDAAFNNAGLQSLAGPIATVTEQAWREVVDGNLTGTFLSLKHEIPVIIASGGGAVLNNASSLGVVGAPCVAPYVAAKHAVIGLTRSAALELAPQGIRVNALVTGTTDSGLVKRLREQLGSGDGAAEGQAKDEDDEEAAVLRERAGGGSPAGGPAGRLGRPAEIAAFAAFLLSDEASFITGAALAIDGGATAD